MMGVSRAGYYKWKNRTPSNRDINREKMIELVKTIHEKHRTHGYRWNIVLLKKEDKGYAICLKALLNAEIRF